MQHELAHCYIDAQTNRDPHQAVERKMRQRILADPTHVTHASLIDRAMSSLQHNRIKSYGEAIVVRQNEEWGADEEEARRWLRENA